MDRGRTNDALERLRVHRIEPAYRQVADQLRALILSGGLSVGEQLPSEDRLGARFGVSRNTVREALRMLSSQNLVETTRGVNGGTFVAVPRPELLKEHLTATLQLMTGSKVIDHDELHEARLILEVPSVRHAALRRTDDDLARLRFAADRVEQGRTVMDRTGWSQDFHQAVMDAAGNRLMSVIAPPVWRVFSSTALEAGDSVRDSWADIDRDHLEILGHIESRRPDEAAAAMEAHLGRLRAHQL